MFQPTKYSSGLCRFHRNFTNFSRKKLLVLVALLTLSCLLLGSMQLFCSDPSFDSVSLEEKELYESRLRSSIDTKRWYGSREIMAKQGEIFHRRQKAFEKVSLLLPRNKRTVEDLAHFHNAVSHVSVSGSSSSSNNWKSSEDQDRNNQRIVEETGYFQNARSSSEHSNGIEIGTKERSKKITSSFSHSNERIDVEESSHSHIARSISSDEDTPYIHTKSSHGPENPIKLEKIFPHDQGSKKIISSSFSHPNEGIVVEESSPLHATRGVSSNENRPYILTNGSHGHGNPVKQERIFPHDQGSTKLTSSSFSHHNERTVVEDSNHLHSTRSISSDEDRPYIHSKSSHSHGNPMKQEMILPRDQAVLSLRETIALAWMRGEKAWKDIESLSKQPTFVPSFHDKGEIPCPRSVFMGEKKIKESHNFMKLPCGLTIGSSISMIGVPWSPHYEEKPRIGHISEGSPVSTQVSQFVFELHAPAPNDYEHKEPPRILHINPRLKGDWSGKPVIELNTFLKGRWGRSQRCDGTSSLYHETVERLPKCEKWLQKDDGGKESSWWLAKLIEKIEKPESSSKFPFSENNSFIMTIRAGLEGYHMSVDGNHVASFPYTTGLLEEVTSGLYVGGNVDIRAMIATSLPSLPPKSLYEKIFDKWQLWKAPKLPKGPIDLFIGVLSAPDHFTQRLAIRSAWFQTKPIMSSDVVARFFVAMHQDKDVNLQMKKEAEHYGDMVILPFMDEYNLVVLKTLAICEYGVNNVSTNYIMKCDDDTFVRVEAVLKELKIVSRDKDLYMGNLNMHHRPLRMGKWAVTFEEWPDEAYPTYANGAGYIISTNISRFVVSEKRQRTLELFKMEDVSMGLWVHQFRLGGGQVNYAHIWKFYQAGCGDGYISAHYQSPRQMVCLHQKLSRGDIQCCNYM